MAISPRRRLAFTLVELLVVIGIIALLVSILLPTMNKARASARALRCLATLRQWGMAQAAYVGECKAWAVPDIQGVSAPVNVRTRWSNNNQFRKALGIREHIAGQGTSNRFPIELLCPEATKAIDQQNRVGGQVQFSYGYNIVNMLVLPDGATGTAISFRGLKATKVHNPAAKLMFADAMDFQINRAHSDDYLRVPGADDQRPGGDSEYVAYRHGGKVNVLFWDGHALTLRRDQVACPDNTSPLWKNLWDPLQVK
jgi:prepilin-type processing-associated H-X9-DG protein/prepilin-type N-terminal cleavage/methylation domain-containing protein